MRHNQQNKRRKQHGPREFDGHKRRFPPAAPHSAQKPEFAAANEAVLVVGRNAIREIARHHPDRIRKAYVVPKEGASSREYEELVLLLQSRALPVEAITKEDLTVLAGTSAHQSFAAELKPRSAPELKLFLEQQGARDQSLLVLLDSIEDPQNLGTILRAAECFSASAVIWSKNRGASLTPAARKASVGASELVEHIEVANLAEAVRRIKDAGFWAVAAECVPDAKEVDSFDFPPRTALILGAEGSGIHALLSKVADFHVKIPIFGRIDSLNVAQAAAVLLHSYRRQHRPVCAG